MIIAYSSPRGVRARCSTARIADRQDCENIHSVRRASRTGRVRNETPRCPHASEIHAEPADQVCACDWSALTRICVARNERSEHGQAKTDACGLWTSRKPILAGSRARDEGGIRPQHRVESRTGAVALVSRWRLTALSRRRLSPVWLDSVSCSRSSNRTGGFPASGSRKRHTLFRVTPSATSEPHPGWLDSSSIPMSFVASCVRL